MAESDNDNKEIARVGTITRIREAGTDYQLEYSLDMMIPPISNTRIKELAPEPDIGDWELMRTHWAIKDVDLFYVLLRNGTARSRIQMLRDTR